MKVLRATLTIILRSAIILRSEKTKEFSAYDNGEVMST